MWLPLCLRGLPGGDPPGTALGQPRPCTASCVLQLTQILSHLILHVSAGHWVDRPFPALSLHHRLRPNPETHSVSELPQTKLHTLPGHNGQSQRDNATGKALARALEPAGKKS